MVNPIAYDESANLNEQHPAFGIMTEKDLQEGEEIDEAYLNELQQAVTGFPFFSHPGS